MTDDTDLTLDDILATRAGGRPVEVVTLRAEYEKFLAGPVATGVYGVPIITNPSTPGSATAWTIRRCTSGGGPVRPASSPQPAKAATLAR